MLSTFSAVTPYLKFNPWWVTIDNFIFRLHYRWSFIILIVFTILVCSRQYIGEHIKCISGSIPSHVVNTYCFFTTTFTLVRHLNNTALKKGAIFQPGIGPYETQGEPITHHAYYQWVPFVLFGQALCFYMPHFIWKVWEGNRIKMLVVGLRMVNLSQYLKNNSLQIGKLNIPSTEETDCRIKDIRRVMTDRLYLTRSWGIHLVIAEVLNLVNLIVQFHWTNVFLGGAFYGLGWKVIKESWTEQMDALDVVFPKVTKCHFHKYGPSGSLQMHDTLCIMALNIINEKIYTILWFWFVFLLISTILGLLWRLCTMFLYKSTKFTYYSFSMAKGGKMDKHQLTSVIKKCNFSNWTFLYFLRSNISGFIFNKIIYHLADEFPSEYYDDDKKSSFAVSDADLDLKHADTVNLNEVYSPLIKQKDINKLA